MSDILNRLKNRPRPTVAERDSSLLKDDEVVQSTTFEDSASVEALPPVAKVNPTSSKIPRKKLAKEVASLPQVAERRQIRLEVTINTELDQLCNQRPKGAKVTVETFVEAAYLACTRDPALMAQILAEAANRLAQRKRAGQLRRLHSQLESEE